MKKIAVLIDRAVTAGGDEAKLEAVKNDVAELARAFPLYAERRAEYAALKED
jgi:glycine/serine hydroxymethyltransferase